MNEGKRNELVELYKAEVHDVVEKHAQDVAAFEIDEDTEELPSSFDEQDFYSLTLGWAMAKGLSVDDSFEFARYIRYNTNYG